MDNRKRTCATMEVHQHNALVDEVYRANRRSIEEFTRTAGMVERTAVLRVPVVVHVLYHTQEQNISEEQIRSQIESLNRDYRLRNEDASSIPAPFRPLATDALVEFALAIRDPDGNPTTGITRTRTSLPAFTGATPLLDRAVKLEETGHSAWPRESYLNVWVCELGDGLLGYAQFPGGVSATDGVVICHRSFGTTGTVFAPFDRGRTATHEIGHWFNLLHIWGDDGQGCTQSDNVGDTPNQAGPNAGKPTFPSVSCTNGPNGDMFMSYMDYVDDDAMCMFSTGQVQRLNAAIAGPRSSLLTSRGLIPVGSERLDLGSAGRTTRVSGPFSDLGPRAKVFDGVGWVDPTDN